MPYYTNIKRYILQREQNLRECLNAFGWSLINTYENMNIVFSYINFEPQTKKIQKTEYSLKKMLQMLSERFFIPSPSLVLLSRIFTQFSFIFPCEFKVALRKFTRYIY